MASGARHGAPRYTYAYKGSEYGFDHSEMVGLDDDFGYDFPYEFGLPNPYVIWGLKRRVPPPLFSELWGGTGPNDSPLQNDALAPRIKLG